MIKRLLAMTAGLMILLPAGAAWAEWTVTNRDETSYELVKQCGDERENWTISGRVRKELSIPAGARSCTITLEKTSCTARSGEGCVIENGRVRKQE